MNILRYAFPNILFEGEGAGASGGEDQGGSANGGTPPGASFVGNGANGVTDQNNANGGAQPGDNPMGGSGQGSNSGGGFDSNGDWRAGFADGLDDDTATAWNNIASRSKSPADFAKSVVELRKSHDQRIALPGADAKHEDWQKVYGKIAEVAPDRAPPKDPKDYEFTDFEDFPMSDADKEHREGFRQVAHDLNLSPHQVKGLEEWNKNIGMVQQDAFSMTASRTQQNRTDAMKASYGPDFDTQINLYNAGLKNMMNEEQLEEFRGMQLADGTFAGDNPLFIEIIGNYARERGEDFRDSNPLNAGQREDAQTQIQKLEDEAIAKGLNPTSQNWPHAQLEALYKRAYPSKPTTIHMGGVQQTQE